MSQKLLVGCLRGPCSPISFSPGGLLVWLTIGEDYVQGGLPALQSPLLGCHLGGSKAGECLAHSRSQQGLASPTVLAGASPSPNTALPA